jgi:hypothetical protein
VILFQGMRRLGEKSWQILGGKAAARLREFRLQRGLTSVPGVNATSMYFAAIQEKKQQMEALAGTTPQPRWSPMGPFSIPHGQTYGAAHPSVSGRVFSRAFPRHFLEKAEKWKVCLQRVGKGVVTT